MSGKRIYELTEKSNLENDYFMAIDKSGTANAQKVNVSKILNPINNISGSADEYSASKAYSVGDLVIHDNKLYKCTTACSAAAWSTNSGYFTQSTLTTELTNVKSSLSWRVLGDHVSYVVANNTEWNEANIVVIVGNDITKEVSFTLNRMIFNAVSGTYNYLNSGYGLSSSNLVTVRIGFDGTYITLNSAYDSGVNVSSTSPMMVYVR